MSMTDRYHDIVRALADGEERHGYALMCAVEEHTNGQVILGPGTLYRAIGRLLDDGLIVQTDRWLDPAVEDERRRYYRITARGRALLDRPGTPLAPLAPPPPSEAHPPAASTTSYGRSLTARSATGTPSCTRSGRCRGACLSAQPRSTTPSALCSRTA